METQTNAIKINDSHLEEFYRGLIPFGYMDVKAAIQRALDAGERPEWASEQITQYMESCQATIDQVDPVYCVLDSILQLSRNKIEELTGYDFMNDFNGRGAIDTHGNFMCSSFDYSDEAITDLKKQLKKHKIHSGDLDEMTLYFLSEIGITLK